MKIKMIGVGIYLPGPKISSKELAERFNINEQWINHFIGTQYRHLSVDIKTGKKIYTLTDIAYQAAIRAMDSANIQTDKIDAIVMTTATPDYLMPTTVNCVLDRLGMDSIPTYALQSGCAGAIQAIDIAMRILKSGPEKYVLVIGGDSCNKFMDFNQDFSKLSSKEMINYMLFGDGAGAVILTNQYDKKGIYIDNVINKCVGKNKLPGQIINWMGLVNKNQQTHAVIEDYKAIEMNVPILTKELMYEVLNANQWKIEDIAYYLPPQLSKVMTDKIISTLNIPYEKTINCVEYTGNNGNALPLIQFHCIFEKMNTGDKGILLTIESSKWIKSGIAFHG